MAKREFYLEELRPNVERQFLSIRKKRGPLDGRFAKSLHWHDYYEIELITGRTHQIRVQFASRRMPLVGDGKYGSRDNKATCALWSHRVRFVHPVTKKVIECVSLPDGGYPWEMFEINR